MIGCGDDDRIDVLAVEDLPKIGEPVSFRCQLGALLEVRRVDVADGPDLDVFQLYVRAQDAASLHARPDDTDADAVVGALKPRESGRIGERRVRADEAGRPCGEKGSAIET